MKNNKKIIWILLLFLFIIAGYLVVKGLGKKLPEQKVSDISDSETTDSISEAGVEAMLQTVTEASIGIEDEKKVERAAKSDVENKETQEEETENHRKKKQKKLTPSPKHSKVKKSKKKEEKKEKDFQEGEESAQTVLPIETNQPVESMIPQKKYICSLSISCTTILPYLESLQEEKKKHIPADGILLKITEVEIQEGDSVYNLLIRAAKENGLILDIDPSFTGYIKGIGNIYEKDFGAQSGWMYRVNGKYPNVGIKGYQVSSGDVIECVYTCQKGDLLDG